MKLLQKLGAGLVLLTLSGCASVVQKPAGSEVFQGHGAEPGWSVEVLPHQAIMATLDNGQNKVQLPWIEPLQAGKTTVYTGKSNGMTFRLTIAPGPCSDGMSDISYPNQVTLVLNEQTYQGCGGTNP